MLPKSTNIETLKINLTNPIFGLRNGEYYNKMFFAATDVLR